MSIISASFLRLRCQFVVNDSCCAAALRVAYILSLQSVERVDQSDWVLEPCIKRDTNFLDVMKLYQLTPTS